MTTSMAADRNSRSTDHLRVLDGLPAGPGAYVLAIDVTAPLTVHVGAKRSLPLIPGRYLYCGSAKGPGGIRARIAHHLRRGKSIHWHIDQLTEAGTVIGAWAFPGGNECDLVSALSHLPVAIKGFGSTDCRRCTSHLLRRPMEEESEEPFVNSTPTASTVPTTAAGALPLPGFVVLRLGKKPNAGKVISSEEVRD
jgi:Uri superfamily endonuclease